MFVDQIFVFTNGSFRFPNTVEFESTTKYVYIFLISSITTVDLYVVQSRYINNLSFTTFFCSTISLVKHSDFERF